LIIISELKGIPGTAVYAENKREHIFMAVNATAEHA